MCRKLSSPRSSSLASYVAQKHVRCAKSRHTEKISILIAGCPPSAEALTYGFLQLQKKIKNMKRTQAYFRS